MPRLLDLFCGAGGCAVGYHRAGFTDIVGVDLRPQPRYPFALVQGDALDYLREHGHEFDAVHASPPCQAYSRCRNMVWARNDHPDLLGPTLDALDAVGRPWVVENVPGAPFGPRQVVELCGTQFGIRVRRHRLFASSVFLFEPVEPCRHRGGDITIAGNRFGVMGQPVTAYVCADGTTRYRLRGAGVKEAGAAMGVNWMTRDALAQAIPPAYTEFLGRQLLAALAPESPPR